MCNIDTIALRIRIGTTMINLTMRQQLTLCSVLVLIHFVLFVLAPT